MVRRTVAGAGLLIVACLLPPPTAWAQQSQSTIAGLVRDAAGVPVAGVKVEASSDVLIEKVRTVVTDGGGQYKIVGLGSGKYDVTFSLPGSPTVKRLGSVFHSTTAPGMLFFGRVRRAAQWI